MAKRGKQARQTDLTPDLFREAMRLLGVTWQAMGEAAGRNRDSIAAVASGKFAASEGVELALRDLIIEAADAADTTVFRNQRVSIYVENGKVMVVGGRIMGCRTAVLGGGK